MESSTLITLIDDPDPIIEQELMNYFSVHHSQTDLRNLELIDDLISKDRFEFLSRLKTECKKGLFHNCLNQVLKKQTVDEINLIEDTLLSMNALFENQISFGKSKEWIENLSLEIRDQTQTITDHTEKLFTISQILFFRNQFSGNHKNYYDPANSDLSSVIKTGLGIPISISMLTYLIARKAGISCFPANIPRHFMLFFPNESPTFLDCFNSGNLLRSNDVEDFLAHLNVHQNPMEFIETNFLVILKRWFQNMAYIYSTRNEIEKLNGLQLYIDLINSVSLNRWKDSV